MLAAVTSEDSLRELESLVLGSNQTTENKVQLNNFVQTGDTDGKLFNVMFIFI